MEPLEATADKILLDWRDRRVRLWLTALRDCPEEFGQWAGLIRVRAESFAEQWQPQASDLIERLGRLPELEEYGSAKSGDVLLPMAADAFEADLVARAVPKSLARRARDLFSVEPPVVQWKF